MTKAAGYLVDLRGWRNAADYDIELPFQEDSLSDAITHAMDVMRILEDYPGDA